MKEQLLKAIKAIDHGGVIVYPTDTTYGLGCDATNEKACQKIISLKKRTNHKGFIVLIDHTDFIYDLVEEVPDVVLEILENTDSPTTLVLDGGKGVAKSVLHEDGTIAIRVVKNDFCEKLIAKFNKPIVSTSVNISGNKPSTDINNIPYEILGAVDYVVPSKTVMNAKPSSIIKIEANGKVKILRA